ncbi:MAG: uracil-DNA glycosylase family protein [Anaerolineae bacterium]|nr:uracil-DNA glycosylase family protein [Anaerolineae bacterium]
MDSLASLHTEMRACRRCLEAGFDIAPGAVFSSGSVRRVMLIGQAPGVTEAQVKRPFNAGSGRRLFQWLGEAGWDEETFRAEQYMTAVTKCYPGKSANGKGDRVPSKTEQALCRPFLEREIALVNPRLIILVGGLAIKLVYPTTTRLEEVIGTAVYFPPESLTNPLNFDLATAVPLGSEQVGSFLEAGVGHGRFIVPLPHPSGASLWPNKPENRQRIARAVDILRGIREYLEV